MYYLFLNKHLLYREWTLSLFRCCEATKDRQSCFHIESSLLLQQRRNLETDNVMKSEREYMDERTDTHKPLGLDH